MANYFLIGASSGIGKQLALKLVDNRNVVYGTYNTTEPSLEHTNLHFYKLNALDQVLNLDFLPEVLDGVIYCPGAINLRPFERIKLEDFNNDFSLQVLGAIKIIQLVVPKLKKSNNASITLISSVAAQLGLPYHSSVSMCKGALEGLVKALAAEYAPKIRVNAIAPSLTDTPLANSFLNTDIKKEANALRHPLKRVGTTSDMANAINFLISPDASWITGQVLQIDGGIGSLKV